MFTSIINNWNLKADGEQSSNGSMLNAGSDHICSECDDVLFPFKR